MTTSVKIEAHCNDDEEVKIIIMSGTANNAGPADEITLQDGETHEDYVYGKRTITVKEVDKK